MRLKVRFNLKLGDHVGYAVRTFSVVNTECGTRSVPYLNGKTALLITPHHEWQPDASAMGTRNNTDVLCRVAGKLLTGNRQLTVKTPDNHLYPQVWDDWVAVGLGS